jgi:predicted AAA+ superfamily ATPase
VEPEIFYYKTKSGREVDFLTSRRGDSRRLVQVCESLAMPETRQREITALGEAMVELKLTQSCIVTRSEEDRIELDSGVIELVPAWRFLLNLPDGSG